MAPNIKPATAFLALLSADARSLTVAEHSRRVEPLGGSASESAKQDISQLVRNVDAEFMAGSDGEGGASDGLMAKQLGGGAGGGVRSLSGSARERFAEQPRIQRLLANIRRKRALTGTVQRGVNKTGEGKAKVVETKMDTEILAEDELLELIECSLDVDSILSEKEIEDVGLLGTCDDGYACVPSDGSTLGGLCTPTSTAAIATARSLQEYCPTGCPAEVCDCYENFKIDNPDCIDALVESCRDGSYVNYCGPKDKLEQAYAQAYCDAYVCFDDAGWFDVIADDGVCDSCTNCYCTLYSSLCNIFEIFEPICQQGSDASYVCYGFDYACSMRDCCAEFGADKCEGGLMNSYMPTPSPGSGGGGVPIGGQPTDMMDPTSGAASNLLMSGGGRYALLGASAVAAAGLAQSLF